MINLYGLTNKINLMPNNKEKAQTICLLNSYIVFYLESKQITEEEAKKILLSLNETETFLKHYFHIEKNQVNDLFNSCEKLTYLYENVLNYANNYNLFNVSIPNINIKELFNYAKDFMKFMGNDVINLFNKLITNNLVYETEVKGYGGKCIRLDGTNSGIIINYYTIPFYKVFAIVHEMGHAYYNYLRKDYNNLARSNIANETMPRIFEQLFLEYLRDNHLVNSNLLDLYERFFTNLELSITNSTYIINKLLLSNQLQTDFHIENIKIRLPHEVFNDFSIIKQKNDDNQDFLSFNYNYYSYAFLLSMIIKEKFKNDETETRKFIQKLPIYARELSAIEFINLFDSDEYIKATNKNIDKVFSKTYYQKQKNS